MAGGRKGDGESECEYDSDCDCVSMCACMIIIGRYLYVGKGLCLGRRDRESVCPTRRATRDRERAKETEQRRQSRNGMKRLPIPTTQSNTDRQEVRD